MTSVEVKVGDKLISKGTGLEVTITEIEGNRVRVFGGGGYMTFDKEWIKTEYVAKQKHLDKKLGI